MKKSSGLGGSIVSNNILKNTGELKWCIREKPINDLDNGWRFLSDIDTEKFLENPANMSVCDWGTVFEIEPAIMKIFDMPIGTDITLISDSNGKYFIYTDSGDKVIF